MQRRCVLVGGLYPHCVLRFARLAWYFRLPYELLSRFCDVDSGTPRRPLHNGLASPQLDTFSHHTHSLNHLLSSSTFVSVLSLCFLRVVAIQTPSLFSVLLPFFWHCPSTFPFGASRGAAASASFFILTSPISPQKSWWARSHSYNTCNWLLHHI